MFIEKRQIRHLLQRNDLLRVAQKKVSTLLILVFLVDAEDKLLY